MNAYCALAQGGTQPIDLPRIIHRVPHYIFHLNRTGVDVAFKDEAHELPDLTAALQKANSRARAVLRRCVRCGPAAVRGTLDIQDGNRQPIARIYLSELMRQIS